MLNTKMSFHQNHIKILLISYKRVLIRLMWINLYNKQEIVSTQNVHRNHWFVNEMKKKWCFCRFRINIGCLKEPAENGVGSGWQRIAGVKHTNSNFINDLINTLQHVKWSIKWLKALKKLLNTNYVVEKLVQK